MASAVGQFPCDIFETQVQADLPILQSYGGEWMEKGRSPGLFTGQINHFPADITGFSIFFYT